MDGDLLPGGKVVLSGEGKWNLGEMCVEWDDQVLRNNLKNYFSLQRVNFVIPVTTLTHKF